MDQLTMDVIDKASGARGRRDAEGVEVFIKEQPLSDAVANLLTLKTRAEAARDKLNDAIKSVAERSGLLAKVVRKAVNAKSGDEADFEEAKREAEQMQIALDAVESFAKVTLADDLAGDKG